MYEVIKEIMINNITRSDNCIDALARSHNLELFVPVSVAYLFFRYIVLTGHFTFDKVYL